MISIKIGETERTLEEATPDWINQQINRRRSDGASICVSVRIRCPGIDMALSTPGCPGTTGGRSPNRDERRVFQLWDDRGLNEEDFTGGNLVAFLRQLQDLVGSC